MYIDPIKPTLTAPGTKRLNPKCDEPLSNIAFKCNLRRYIKDPDSGKMVEDYWETSKKMIADANFLEELRKYDKVRRCSLTVSKHGLNVCLVSALETKL